MYVKYAWTTWAESAQLRVTVPQNANKRVTGKKNRIAKDGNDF